MMSAMLEAAGPTDISLGTQEAMEHSRDSRRQLPSAAATTRTRVRTHQQWRQHEYYRPWK